MTDVEVRYEDIDTISRSDYEYGDDLKPCTNLLLKDGTDIEIRGSIEQQFIKFLSLKRKVAERMPDEVYGNFLKLSMKEKNLLSFRVESGVAMAVVHGIIDHTEDKEIVDIIKANLKENDIKATTDVFTVGERKFFVFLTHPLKHKKIKIHGGFYITNPPPGQGPINMSPFWRANTLPARVNFLSSIPATLQHAGNMDTKIRKFVTDEMGYSLQNTVALTKDFDLSVEVTQEAFDKEMESYPKYIREYASNSFSDLVDERDPTLWHLVEATAHVATFGVEKEADNIELPPQYRMKMFQHGHDAVLRLGQ